MTIDIAKHIRIYKLDPDDDFVTKRTHAIKSIEDFFKRKTSVKDILALAENLSVGLKQPSTINADIISVVERSIKKQSSSFIADGQELEIITCALLSVLQHLHNQTDNSKAKLSTADVIGIALLSALSFQTAIADKQKLEILRQELISVSGKLVAQQSFLGRQRLAPVEVAIKDLATIPELSSALQKAVNISIEILKINASLDREEINVLWWAMNDWSEIVGQKINNLNDVQRIVVSGCEVARRLIRLPGEPYSNLILRGVNRNAEITAHELIDQLGDVREKLAFNLSSADKDFVHKYPNVFPLFNIVISGPQDIEEHQVKRTMIDWSIRTLLEGSILNLQNLLNDDQ